MSDIDTDPLTPAPPPGNDLDAFTGLEVPALTSDVPPARGFADGPALVARWHTAAACVQLASFVAMVVIFAVYYEQNLSFEVTYYRGRGESPVLFRYQPAWLILAFTLLTAGSHVLQANRYRHDAAFARAILRDRTRANALQWIEYAVTASLMTVVIAQLSGMRDLLLLVLLVLMNVAMQALGYAHEAANTYSRRRGKARFPRTFWTAFGVAWLLFVAIWLAIAWYFVASATSLCPGETLPWFVWAVFFVLLVFFAQFGVAMALHFASTTCRTADALTCSPAARADIRWGDPVFNAIVYCFLSLNTKLALEWITFAGLIDFALNTSGAAARQNAFRPCPVVNSTR